MGGSRAAWAWAEPKAAQEGKRRPPDSTNGIPARRAVYALRSRQCRTTHGTPWGRPLTRGGGVRPASLTAKEGAVAPKSRKGGRRAPIPASLRRQLLEHKLRTGRDGEDFVFGRTAPAPFTPTRIRKRALKAWAAENAKRGEEERPLLVPIGLHELRHSY